LGFAFSQEILTRYFISLKTKPFVILTGISGTGKTKIAQIFAEYICQHDSEEERRKRIAFIPVRPDWMDNKGLLGFYNILDEKYYDTPLLRLILNAHSNPSKPHFAILDEMNLSKVEMYFSDFLSIMESRTVHNKKGEYLSLHSRNEAKTPSGMHVPDQICIPENVYFTGTVNVDETTYMFSPKVLDRANVIEFNDVELEGYTEGTQKPSKFCLVDAEVIEKFSTGYRSAFCSSNDFKELRERVPKASSFINELLDILKEYNLHFGYRVVNEMSRFILLAQEHLASQFSTEDAFDIQMLQKILPKFHGTRAKLEKPLNELLPFCSDRFPRTKQKIDRMMANLKVQGYTSFIE